MEKDFETNMTYDYSSFPGFTHEEVKSLLQTQAELDEEYDSEVYEENEDDIES